MEQGFDLKRLEDLELVLEVLNGDLENHVYSGRIFIQFLEAAYAQYRQASNNAMEMGNREKAAFFEGYAQGISVSLKTYSDLITKNF